MASGGMALQLVQALKQMPVEELRSTMPELEQLLSSVRGMSGSSRSGDIHPAESASAMQQTSSSGGADVGQMGGAGGGTFLPVRGGSQQVIGDTPGAQVTGDGSGSEGTGAGQRVQGQRPGEGGSNRSRHFKLPLVEGAELEAFAARGPLTIMVGRSGEMSHVSRGRGNWRRGLAVSSVGRVKFGKGGFGRNSLPPGNGTAVTEGSSEIGEGDGAGGEGQKCKRAKRGEGPRAHRVRRDPEVEGFKCCYCHNDTHFATREELAEHKTKMHEGKKQTLQSIPCPVCALPCKDKHLLAIHMRVHTGERPYECSKCPAKFRSTSGLNAHMRKHAGIGKTFLCFCGQSFASHASCARHQETAHKSSTPQTCSTCGAEFAGLLTLQAHKRRVHGELKGSVRKRSHCYQCSKCEKSFNRELALARHMNVEHEGLQPYSCNECGMSFATAFKYKSHMERHNPGTLLTRKVRCSLCQARFQNQLQFVNHMLKHHANQPQAASLSLKCEVCGKQVKNYNKLQQHMLEHRKDWKGFECKHPGCEQFFQTRYLLSKHQVLHKGSNLTCEQCDKTFANESSFKSHQRLHDRARDKGEEVRSRRPRPPAATVEDGGDKTSRKRHKSTGRPKGRPRMHPRREDGEGTQGGGEGGGGGGGSGDVGDDGKGAAAGAEGGESKGRSSNKKRKTVGAVEGGEAAGEQHACPKCAVLFASVYDMYAHLRNCGGAVGAGVEEVQEAGGEAEGGGGTRRGAADEGSSIRAPNGALGSCAVVAARGGETGGGAGGAVGAGGGVIDGGCEGGLGGAVREQGGQGTGRLASQPQLQDRVRELEAELAGTSILPLSLYLVPYLITSNLTCFYLTSFALCWVSTQRV